MNTCSTCHNAIPDPAKSWPNGSGGTLRQDCWEVESGAMWWVMVQALDRADLLGSSGTAAWEAQA